MTSRDEFFERLKIELERNQIWPAEYLFKFIVPTNDDKIQAVQTAFDGMGAVIKTTKSKNAKYTSLSINVMMSDANAVIAKYIEVSGIEGIISL
jgi:uncharacterized protein